MKKLLATTNFPIRTQTLKIDKFKKKLSTISKNFRRKKCIVLSQLCNFVIYKIH